MKLPPRTLYLNDAKDALVLLDQTVLPNEERYVELTTLQGVYDAIKDLQVRGAPAIGVAAALGLYVHMKRYEGADFDAELARASAYLNTARPTAVNLQWALNEMTQAENKTVEDLLRTAERILAGDVAANRKIGQHGAALLKEGMGILTHCNAGSLATAGYGTALAPIYFAHERGMKLRVYADETRPVLQGARLTAFELDYAGVDVTLLCDNMAATVMANGWVDAVFVGADRVAANGDTANKVGTHGVAILAEHFGIPFYVCAPMSTIDKNTATGADIIIEERDPREVTEMWYAQPMAPVNVKVFNPSFDVTPAGLITAFITENGLISAPF